MGWEFNHNLNKDSQAILFASEMSELVGSMSKSQQSRLLCAYLRLLADRTHLTEKFEPLCKELDDLRRYKTDAEAKILSLTQQLERASK